MNVADYLKAQQDSIKVVPADKVGFSGLGSEGFLKILIAQLQNQDPSSPTDNQALMAQLSSIQEVQSNVELKNSLKALTTSQSISGASSVIGQQVTGLDAQSNEVTGVVDGVTLVDNKAYLTIGDQRIAYDTVKQIKPSTQLQQLLQSLTPL